MKNIICTQVLKDLAGDYLKVGDKDFTLGQALANIVVGDGTGGKMKLYTLGTRLYQNDSVEVDEADLALIKAAVKVSNAYGAVVVGQVESILENL